MPEDDGAGPTESPDAEGSAVVVDSSLVEQRARAVEQEVRTAPSALKALPAEPGVSKPQPILTVTNLVRDFGGLRAVDVERLEFQQGCITALIGPNGAGKTTLFNLLTGFDRPQSGEWEFQGRRLTGVPAYRAARRGIVRTFQLTKALARMTVLENMMLAGRSESGHRQRGEKMTLAMLRPLWRDQEVDIERRAVELLDRFGLRHMAGEYAGTLSGGQRKLLEMARALMTGPSLVMLDEPTAGVNPALTQSILEHVKELRADGLTVVFVEHDMDVIMGISDWVVCLAQGRVIAEGPPDAIGRNPTVIDAYLGTHYAGDE